MFNGNQKKVSRTVETETTEERRQSLEIFI